MNNSLLEEVALPFPYGLRRASVEDVCGVHEIICAEEILEVWHLHRSPVEDVLKKTVEMADCGHGEVYTLCVGDEIIGMGGVFPLHGMGRHGAEIWFVGMDLRGHKRLCVEHIRPVIQYFIEKYPILMNVVGVWNLNSIRWLRHMGFHVEDRPICVGKNEAYFHRFYLTKAVWDLKHKGKKLCV